MNKTWVKIVVFALFIKIVYYFFAFGVSKYSSKFPPIDLYTFKNDSIPGLFKIFKIHDAGWYEMIALNGHHKITEQDLRPTEKNNWAASYYAFFPLYPLITGVTLRVTGWHYFTSAYIWSVIFSITCFLLFHRFARHFLNDERSAYYATLCLIFFPFHFYFSAFMTEALFLLLLILAFASIKNKNWVVLAVSGSLLSLTRPNGIYMIVPLLIYFFENYRREKLTRQQLMYPAIAFLCIGLTFTGYCFYLNYMTGDYFAFATAQQGWYKKFTVIPFTSLFNTGNWRYQFYSIYTIVFMLIALVAITRIPISFQALIWTCMLLPLIAGSAQSMPRYITVIFPFSIIIGKYVSTFRYRNIIVFLFFIAHLWSFYYWLTEDPLTF